MGILHRAKFILLLLILLLCPSTAFSGGGTKDLILFQRNIADTDGVLVYTLTQSYWKSGYLVVTTDNAAGTPTLTGEVFVHMLDGTKVSICVMDDVVDTDGQEVTLVGAMLLTAVDDIDLVCKWPITAVTTFEFEVTAAGAGSYDVDIEFLALAP